MRVAFLSLLVWVQQLNAAEILLHTGQAFIVDVIEEQETVIKVNWKGGTYAIPRSRIRSYDPLRRGPHIAYQYVDLTLNDGNRLSGAIAEETSESLTLRTQLGFISVDKSRIKSRNPPADQLPVMPDAYAYKPGQMTKSRLGLSAVGHANRSPVAPSAPYSHGGALWLEPAFARRGSFAGGVRLEYMQAPGRNGTFSFLNNLLYVQYHPQRLQTRFGGPYLGLGGGAAAVRFSGQESTLSGNTGLMLMELGWQIPGERLLFRMALRGLGYAESKGTYATGGLDLSLGVRL